MYFFFYYPIWSVVTHMYAQWKTKQNKKQCVLQRICKTHFSQICNANKFLCSSAHCFKIMQMWEWEQFPACLLSFPTSCFHAGYQADFKKDTCWEITEDRGRKKWEFMWQSGNRATIPKWREKLDWINLEKAECSAGACTGEFLFKRQQEGDFHFFNKHMEADKDT